MNDRKGSAEAIADTVRTLSSTFFMNTMLDHVGNTPLSIHMRAMMAVQAVAALHIGTISTGSPNFNPKYDKGSIVSKIPPTII